MLGSFGVRRRAKKMLAASQGRGLGTFGLELEHRWLGRPRKYEAGRYQRGDDLAGQSLVWPGLALQGASRTLRLLAPDGACDGASWPHLRQSDGPISNRRRSIRLTLARADCVPTGAGPMCAAATHTPRPAGGTAGPVAHLRATKTVTVCWARRWPAARTIGPWMVAGSG